MSANGNVWPYTPFSSTSNLSLQYHNAWIGCRKELIPAVDNNRTTSLCCIMESLMQEERGFKFDDKDDEHVRVT